MKDAEIPRTVCQTLTAENTSHISYVITSQMLLSHSFTEFLLKLATNSQFSDLGSVFLITLLSSALYVFSWCLSVTLKEKLHALKVFNVLFLELNPLFFFFFFCTVIILHSVALYSSVAVLAPTFGLVKFSHKFGSLIFNRCFGAILLVMPDA